MRKVSPPFWILLSVALLAFLAVAYIPPVRAADAEDTQTEKQVETKPEPGFWERNWVLTELLGVPVLMFLIAIAMASNSTTDTIKTNHWTVDGRLLARSTSQVSTPTQPASTAEIHRALIVFPIIYLALRFTCGFGFINGFWQFVGSLVDVLFAAHKT